MIYRIAIGSMAFGDWKFVRYAIADEIGSLRVNRHGLVEMLVKQHYGYVWEDVSNTHKVEWGVMRNGKPLYVNDIIFYKHEYVYIDPMRRHEVLNKYHVSGYIITQNEESGEFMLKCFAIIEKHNVNDFINRDIGKLEILRFIGKDMTIVGNINENPELFEQQNKEGEE